MASVNKLLTTAVLAALLGAPRAAYSQSEHHTVLMIGVGDAESGAFIPSAQVRIASLSVSAVADEMGRARLPDVSPGTYTLEVRRIGYSPLSTPVKVTTQDTLEVVLLLQPVPQTLSTVTVRAAAPTRGLEGFESRLRQGKGHYITGAQLDSAPNRELSDVVAARLPGLRIQTAPGAEQKVYSMRGTTSFGSTKGCEALVFLDGVHLLDGDVSFIRPGDLAGVEYYTESEIPPQYRIARSLPSKIFPDEGDPGCGVMLLWTKR